MISPLFVGGGLAAGATVIGGIIFGVKKIFGKKK
jgi:hypothetical protein